MEPPSNRRVRPRGRARSPEPGTLGARLRRLRELANMTQDDLADAAHTTKPTISRYETNDFRPPDPVVERLADIFRVSKAFLRDGDAGMARAQVVGIVGAAAEVFPSEEDLDLGGIEVPGAWTDAVALRVQGDSMLPLYQEGGHLIIRGEPRFLEEEALRRICEVRLEDGRALVKEVRRGAGLGRYDLLSLNAAPIENVKLVSARPVRAYFPPS